MVGLRLPKKCSLQNATTFIRPACAAEWPTSHAIVQMHLVSSLPPFTNVRSAVGRRVMFSIATAAAQESQAPDGEEEC